MCNRSAMTMAGCETESEVGTPAGLHQSVLQFHAIALSSEHRHDWSGHRHCRSSASQPTMSSTHCRNDTTTTPEKGVQVAPQSPRPTSILHRTPWQPPVAVSGQGIYITLEDGQEVIDAVGGAAVACIGNGHPVVSEAIKEQVDKLACEWPLQFRGA
jgi:4-aminobutyrate aminotransferase-like enzyme